MTNEELAKTITASLLDLGELHGALMYVVDDSPKTLFGLSRVQVEESILKDLNGSR